MTEIHKILTNLVEDIIECEPEYWHQSLKFRKAAIKTAADQINAIFQAERERVEKLETRLRIIANTVAVIIPAEKCQQLLAQIHNDALAELEAE